MSESPSVLLWLSQPAQWTNVLGPGVRVCDSAGEVIDIAPEVDAIVVDSTAGLERWLRAPAARPPCVVLAAARKAETEALRLGAEETLPLEAPPEAVPRAVARARARHTATLEALGRTEVARFETMVSALPDIVSHLKDDGLVLDFHVPPAFETEFPADALLGRRLGDVIPADLAAKFDEAVASVRATGQAVAYDYAVAVGTQTKHREVRVAPLGPGEVISMIRDVTALREHEEALTRSRADLRALAERLQGVREAERTRLSREVHDVIGQQLTAIRLGAGWFGRHAPDDEAVQARLSDLRAIIDETLGLARRIASDLRPGVLDDFGLRSAVEWQAGRFEEQTGLTCLVTVESDGPEPPRDVATAAFRIVQEALTNVARHAEAATVEVRLAFAPDALRLEVADDGRGFGPEAAAGRRSLGVLGMRERARALGGTLRVQSEPGQGTTVGCTFRLLPPSP